MTHAHVISRT